MFGETHRVLVIDDDDAMRESLTALLKLEGFEACGARNGREALDYLHSHRLPCVIVLDLTMPLMSGPEFRAEQLLDDALAHIPVVIMTGSKDVQRQARALRAADCFTKPLPLGAFIDSLRSHCWLAWFKKEDAAHSPEC